MHAEKKIDVALGRLQMSEYARIKLQALTVYKATLVHTSQSHEHSLRMDLSALLQVKLDKQMCSRMMSHNETS